jgi:purine-binding chemotaxis protein CheW
MINYDHNPQKRISEFVTVTVDGHLFGLPISRVHDVFVPDRVTRVPLAPSDVVGLLNLRGRVMTVIEMRTRLALAARMPDQPVMAIGIELNGESYGLLVDAVGEVMQLQRDSIEPNPANLDPRLGQVSVGIHRLEGQLMVVLDVDRVLDVKNTVMVA